MICSTSLIACSLALLANVSCVLGALFQHPGDLPTNRNYDFIVVGSGAGGGLIASKLAEAKYKTLVIEAGIFGIDNEAVQTPFLCTTLTPGTIFDWNYTTVPQAGLNGRTIAYPRGKLLGGSTSVNYMAFTRGSRDDFDRLANATSDPSWSWDELHPLILEIDRMTPPADGHNTTGEFDPTAHGKHGSLGISLHIRQYPDDFVLAATQELPEFSYNIDYNSGSPLGIGFSQGTVLNGSRDSSAIAFLMPALNAFPNLDILLNAQVSKLIRTGSEGNVPVFRGVEFATPTGATLYSAQVSKEIVLSSGAIGTPQLLMLSGIGNATQLLNLGIDPVVNLPDVGANLQDHPLLGVSFRVNSSVPTVDDARTNTTYAAEQQALWERNHTGLYASPTSGYYGWHRLPDNASIFETVADPSAGSLTPHFELLFSDGYAVGLDPIPDEGRFFSVRMAVVTPTSRGSLSLASVNWFDKPLIDPAFLQTDFDIFAMREAVKAIRRFMQAPAWNGYIEGEYGSSARALTDEQIEAWARNQTGTVFHPVGTARMSPFGSEEGVVNPDLTVKGTKGLRIVDASVFPFIPAGHTQSPTYIIAKKASGVILRDARREG
ncbi:alcohol oxidase [Vararia minispora EC-137]|uniref:Alcohol oxidase n=1 Tax=Vararia minispora EC-137 TaxID=1314806 RepID=A0ACB8QPB1_9AGAM|nr:alcohol oxidase [Vararia minispora EC-137]